MLINICNPLFCKVEGNGRVMQNLYTQPEPQQKLMSSSYRQARNNTKFINIDHYFFSNTAHRQTHRQNDTDHITNLFVDIIIFGTMNCQFILI